MRFSLRGRSDHLIDRVLSNVEHGRFERSLSGLTAFAAVVTTAEIYLEHYRASFGNKMMWSPVVVTPPVVVAGIAGVFSRRWAKRYLPVAAAASPRPTRWPPLARIGPGPAPKPR